MTSKFYMFAFYISLVACVTYVSSYSDDYNTVFTLYGPVRGRRQSVTSHNTSVTLDTFLGVPYAKPPVGNLRWARPQFPSPWNEERWKAIFVLLINSNKISCFLTPWWNCKMDIICVIHGPYAASFSYGGSLLKAKESPKCDPSFLIRACVKLMEADFHNSKS